MKAKLAFIAGLGAGYVVGTKVGHRGYDNLKKNARALWETDKVQESVTHLQTSVKDAAVKATSGSSASPKPRQADITPAASEKPLQSLPDVESDPALNDHPGQDWADEGGALPSGPAA